MHVNVDKRDMVQSDLTKRDIDFSFQCMMHQSLENPAPMGPVTAGA